MRARHGKLKAVKFGRNWVTTQDWLKEYLENADEHKNLHNQIEKKQLESHPSKNLPIAMPIRFFALSGTGVRSIFLAILAFSLLANGIVFGKENLKTTFDNVNKIVMEIGETVDLAMDIAGKDLQINHIEGPLGVMGRNSDNRLILAKLGWRPSHPLRDGMEKTYSWIKKQVEEAEQHRS